MVILLYSCEYNSLDDLNDFVSDGDDLTAIERSLATSLIEVFEASAATRKLMSLTITDHETGQTTTYYDCTEPGHSCDVGEPAPDPNPPRRALEIPEEETVFEYLQNNELKYSAIYPVMFDSLVIDKVQTQKIDFEYQNGFLTIVHVSNSKPLYGYEVEAMALVKEPKYEMRKGKMNTQSGVFECIEEGHNCRVKIDEKTDLISELAFIQAGFPGMNLSQLLYHEDYILYKDSTKFTLMPPDTTQSDVYYLVYE